MAVDKRALRDELARALADELLALERAHQATREGATHEEAKPENDKDTRALEQSYLARGQALRIEEARAGLTDVRAMPLRAFEVGAPAALSAIVTLTSDEEPPQTLFLAPAGGGTRLAGGVSVVTPRSPLGRAVLGRFVDDDVEVSRGGAVRTVSIASID